MRKLLLLSLLAAAAAYGGKSIESGIASITNSSIPTTLQNRLEFYMDSATLPPVVDHVLACQGWSILWYADRFEITDAWAISPSASISINSNLVQPGAWFRFGRNVSGHVSNIEMWNTNGQLVRSATITFSSTSAGGNGCSIGQGAEHARTFAFLRMHTNLLPLGSRPPTIVDDVNRVFEWKFDSRNNTGILADDVPGNAYPPSVTGTVAYSDTLNANVISVISTVGHPTWANIVSQRSGYGLALDGSQSFAQDDTSSAVTYFWQLLSGPTALSWKSGDHTAQSPLLQGNVFGDYQMQLVVRSAGGVTAVSTAHIGSVSMDSNGVVVQANPTAGKLYGDMIAYGKNPWGFADYWSFHAMGLRAGTDGVSGVYKDRGWIIGSQNKPQFAYYGTKSDGTQATVDYYYNGLGWQIGHHTGTAPIGTTLTASVSTSGTVLHIADYTQLDLSDLPTTPTRIILVQNSSGGLYTHEVIRICSYTVTSSPAADLTVCYDGRGQTPLAFASSDKVAQGKITGTGSRFLTDPVAAICPVGANSPPGPAAAWGGGTIHLTANSAVATLTGSGGFWQSTKVETYDTSKYTTAVGYSVRVVAAHGGVPFTFVAQNTTGGVWASASVSGGAVTAVNPLYGIAGTGYVSGQVAVVFSGGGGAGATATATVSGGAITGYTVTSGGSGYTSAPDVFIRPTAITLNRVFPSDADTNDYATYAFLEATRTVVLNASFITDPSSEGGTMFPTDGCESETSAYMNIMDYGRSFAPSHDNGNQGSHQTGRHYGVTDLTGFLHSGGGPFWYGEGMGSWQNYLRSGLDWAKTAADVVNDYVKISPWFNPETLGFSPLQWGPVLLSAQYNEVQKASPDWGYIRAGAAVGESIINQFYNSGSFNCDYYDSRNAGWSFALTTTAAIYDPDTVTFRPRWITDMNHMLAVDNACKQPDNSWKNATLFNPTGSPANPTSPALTLTNGSKIVTAPGGGLTPTHCQGTAHGTGSVISGSGTFTVATGTIPTGMFLGQVAITGTKSGVRFTGLYTFSGTSSPYQIAVLWPGDTGSVTWVTIDTNGYALSVYGRNGADYTVGPPASGPLTQNYVCEYNSATQLTLDHAWEGPTDTTYHLYNYDLAGRGQQPFMLGIRVLNMDHLAKATPSDLASIASSYSTLNSQAINWIVSDGINQNSLTTYYGRGFEFCEPTATDNGTAFYWQTVNCGFGAAAAGAAIGRAQNQEISNALADYYEYSPTTGNKLFVDKMYGGVWGNSLFNTGGVYYDANSLAGDNFNASNLLDSEVITKDKWYGFFGGAGMPHRYPAVRYGGVATADTKTIKIPFRLANVANAAEVSITVTEPNGVAHSAVVCTTSPCAVSADARQGSHLYKMDYRKIDHAVIAPGETLPLYVR